MHYKVFWGARDTIDQDQLKNQRYIIWFGHTKALLFSKKDHIWAKIPVLGNLTHMCKRFVDQVIFTNIFLGFVAHFGQMG